MGRHPFSKTDPYPRFLPNLGPLWLEHSTPATPTIHHYDHRPSPFLGVFLGFRRSRLDTHLSTVAAVSYRSRCFLQVEGMNKGSLRASRLPSLRLDTSDHKCRR